MFVDFYWSNWIGQPMRAKCVGGDALVRIKIFFVFKNF